MPGPVDCLIEIGRKRAFACAAAWPGWCRSGRDEAAALAALLADGDRYADMLRGSGQDFTAPSGEGALRVVERVPGNATTDFGAPDGVFDLDASTIDPLSWRRSRAVLEACWSAFDASVSAARGRELSKGPRGGGRDLDAIVDHVVQAEASYLRALTGAGPRVSDDDDAWSVREAERVAVLGGLDRAQRGEIPERGPRGGKRWTPRRFLRRTAWHVLDHAWEIEDRAHA